MDKDLPQEFRSFLLNIIDCKLISALALIYVYDSEEKILSPQELLLVFEHKRQVTLMCSNDGESLILDSRKLEPTNLGEYGKEIIRDISYLPCWKNLIGQTLTKIFIIKSLGKPCLIGLKFSFENDLSVIVVNLGDEIFMFEFLPEEIAQEEEIIYEQVR